VFKAAKLPPQSGAQRLVGFAGVALTDLTPTGQVQVDQQLWSAASVAGNVRAGESIIVVGVAGVRLQVRPADDAPVDPGH